MRLNKVAGYRNNGINAALPERMAMAGIEAPAVKFDRFVASLQTPRPPTHLQSLSKVLLKVVFAEF
jgi:hypothetical protein